MKRIESNVRKCFKVDRSIAISSLLSTASAIVSSNNWYKGTIYHFNRPSIGQREIFYTFASFYNIKNFSAKTILEIANIGESRYKGIGLYGPCGLATHSSWNFYNRTKLTNNGFFLADYLADSLNKDMEQFEVNAIICCLGFDRTPSLEDFPNYTKNCIENYLTGKKRYSPGLDSFICEIKEDKKISNILE